MTSILQLGAGHLGQHASLPTGFSVSRCPFSLSNKTSRLALRKTGHGRGTPQPAGNMRVSQIVPENALVLISEALWLPQERLHGGEQKDKRTPRTDLSFGSPELRKHLRSTSGVSWLQHAVRFGAVQWCMQRKSSAIVCAMQWCVQECAVPLQKTSEGAVQVRRCVWCYTVHLKVYFSLFKQISWAAMGLELGQF
ncbi:unnamed protein product [Ixodes pacificus]